MTACDARSDPCSTSSRSFPMFASSCCAVPGAPSRPEPICDRRPIRRSRATGRRAAIAPARGDLEAAVSTCVDELLAIPPGPLAMTRAMTSAIGRTAPAMVAGWGDADHQQWAFTEDEYRDAARAYVGRTVRRDKP